MMANIKLYIATSLDGYIARKNNSLDWLNAIEVPEGEDYGYADFYSGVDTVVMGSKTYKEVLGFGVDWPYTDCNSYVVSRQNDLKMETPNTHLINEISKESIANLRSGSEKGIWLVGGGHLIKEFLAMESVDEFIITIIPILLGEGIPLFPEGFKDTTLKLLKVESFSTGVVNLHYKNT